MLRSLSRSTLISAIFAAAAAVAAALTGVGCDRGPAPSDRPEAQIEAQKSAATRPAGPSAIELGDPLAPMRKRAEGGDVSAMITLGRTYESLGTADGKRQAKEWYQKAAATGDPSAQEALKNLEAAASQPSVAAAGADASGAAADAAEPLIQNSVPGVGGATTAPSAGSSPPPQARATTAPSSPADLAHLKWAEVVGSVDTRDFVNVARPDYVPKPGMPPAFVGLSASPDKTMTIAGSGPTGDDIQMVSVVIRVRNRQDLGNSTRVLQGAAVVNKVTRENVTQKEFIDWVGQYLQTNTDSEPIYRNGWRISISGPAGKGMRDPKEYLGAAVLIEMKKA